MITKQLAGGHSSSSASSSNKEVKSKKHATPAPAGGLNQTQTQAMKTKFNPNFASAAYSAMQHIAEFLNFYGFGINPQTLRGLEISDWVSEWGSSTDPNRLPADQSPAYFAEEGRVYWAVVNGELFRITTQLPGSEHITAPEITGATWDGGEGEMPLPFRDGDPMWLLSCIHHTRCQAVVELMDDGTVRYYHADFSSTGGTEVEGLKGAIADYSPRIHNDDDEDVYDNSNEICGELIPANPVIRLYAKKHTTTVKLPDARSVRLV
jgi:hypothetical protein